MMPIGKQGQGIITLIYFDIVFIVLWALFLGGWLNETAQAGIQSNNLVGLEAFILANLNWLLFLALIMVNVGTFAVFGGEA